MRDALRLAAAQESWPWPDATAVGGWWNRAFQPEVVPGFEPGTTGFIAVSRAGVTDTVSAQVALCWGAEEVVAAFAGQ